MLAVEQVIRSQERKRGRTTRLETGAISGKGGVGKSTVAGTLARLFAEGGQRVLAIDADPDANLASALGVPAECGRRSTPSPTNGS